MNLNHLGKAVLGENEARHRLGTYVADLRNPQIECISVKISTIYSQIQSLAFEHTVGTLVDRLLYRLIVLNLELEQQSSKIGARYV